MTSASGQPVVGLMSGLFELPTGEAQADGAGEAFERCSSLRTVVLRLRDTLELELRALDRDKAVLSHARAEAVQDVDGFVRRLRQGESLGLPERRTVPAIPARLDFLRDNPPEREEQVRRAEVTVNALLLEQRRRYRAAAGRWHAPASPVLVSGYDDDGDDGGAAVQVKKERVAEAAATPSSERALTPVLPTTAPNLQASMHTASGSEKQELHDEEELAAGSATDPVFESGGMESDARGLSNTNRMFLWTKERSERLLQLLEQYPLQTSQRQRWVKIAEAMGDVTWKQVMSRANRVLRAAKKDKKDSRRRRRPASVIAATTLPQGVSTENSVSTSTLGVSKTTQARQHPDSGFHPGGSVPRPAEPSSAVETASGGDDDDGDSDNDADYHDGSDHRADEDGSDGDHDGKEQAADAADQPVVGKRKRRKVEPLPATVPQGLLERRAQRMMLESAEYRQLQLLEQRKAELAAAAAASAGSGGVEAAAATATATATVAMATDDAAGSQASVLPAALQFADEPFVDANADSSVVHAGFGCDGCDSDPIVGTRYLCLNCPIENEVDLCHQCYTRGTFSNQQHTPQHLFTPIHVADGYQDQDYHTGNNSYLDPRYQPT